MNSSSKGRVAEAAIVKTLVKLGYEKYHDRTSVHVKEELFDNDPLEALQ